MKTKQTHDLAGREYARKSQVREGTWLIADSDFTCLPANGALRKVFRDKGGLWIRCNASSGQHYLDGQFNDAQTHYVGFYLAPRSGGAKRK